MERKGYITSYRKEKEIIAQVGEIKKDKTTQSNNLIGLKISLKASNEAN